MAKEGMSFAIDRNGAEWEYEVYKLSVLLEVLEKWRNKIDAAAVEAAEKKEEDDLNNFATNLYLDSLSLNIKYSPEYISKRLREYLSSRPKGAN